MYKECGVKRWDQKLNNKRTGNKTVNTRYSKEEIVIHELRIFEVRLPKRILNTSRMA